MNMNKTCTLCKKSCPIDQFNKKGHNRIQSRCKSCVSKLAKKYYLKDKDKYNKKARINMPIYRKRNREYFSQYKLDRGCEFCSEKEPVCLDFHHLDPNEKEDTIARLCNNGSSIDTILVEVNKCIVVCSNCHRKLHAGLLKHYNSRIGNRTQSRSL